MKRTEASVSWHFQATNRPLEECEKRDTKGLHAKARRGEIENVTGIDDPYEAPQHPELLLETNERGAEENARLILAYLLDHGFVSEASGSTQQTN